MLKKLTNSKKGFTLVEILVAVSILGIIVGPLLISLFSNNRIIEQARKETEATYVAKKVMEETLADYYLDISGTVADGAIDGMGYPVYIGKLVALLGKTSKGNPYTPTEGYKSRYADDFTYDVKIVPSGKNGLGVSDSSANYLHVYTDKVDGMDNVFVVSPNGDVRRVLPNLPDSYDPVNDFVVGYSNSSCNMSFNASSVINNSALIPSKEILRIVCYSSWDATNFQYKFDASTNWPNNWDIFLSNYTSRNSSSLVDVTADTDFIPPENVTNFYSSDREQWDVALYEITVSVYEGKNLLSSAESVIEVKIFP